MDGTGLRLRHVGLVFAGGCFGATARVAFATWFPGTEDSYPWTTFAENVTGAFLLAITLQVVASRARPTPTVQLFVGTGTLGAFTTYSTFAVEIERLLGADRVILAATYAGASLLAGIAAAGAGLALGRALTARPGRTDTPGGTQPPDGMGA